MNYLAEINAFYDLIQIKQLSTGQINLWHALMHINNRCAWIEWFTVSNLTLELNTGMSRSGVAKARNSLKQYGLIDFKANGTKATSYKMITMLKSKQERKQISNRDDDTMLKSEQDCNQIGVQNGNQSSNQNGNQIGDTLNKQNETKRNETIATAVTECLGLVSTFVLQECLSYLDELPESVIVEALERTSRADGNWNYCKKILDDRVKRRN